MYLFNLLEGEGAQPKNDYMWVGFLVILVILVVVSVIQNKQRKKQMAQEQERVDRLCPGTIILTRGGIMGTVVSVNDDENSFVLDSEGSLIKFDKRAIYQMTLPDEAKANNAEDKFDKAQSNADKTAE